MNKQGYVHVYTGNGKGKTTCSIGLVIRALANDYKVSYIYFHKNPEKWGYGELKIIEQLGSKVRGFALDTPHFNKSIHFDEIRKDCLKGLAFIREEYKKNYDLMVIDEFNIALREKYLTIEEGLSIIKEKPENLEVVLTGRNALPEIIEIADLVTEMKEIKHYYSKGVKSRRGIER